MDNCHSCFTLFAFESNYVPEVNTTAHPGNANLLAALRERATPEQVAVAATRAKRVTCVARAGTGKTTTLCLFAAERPSARLLYVAFNRSIAIEAQARMPSNVACKTSHALAYRKVRELFGDRPGKLGNTYPSVAARALGCSTLIAVGALQTIQSWCCSTATEMTTQHVPAEIAARTRAARPVLDAAQRLWVLMCAPESEVMLTHDGYLKLFQLDAPILRGFDYVMCDEAQDLNPAMLDILSRQQAKVVLVGDPAQAIYGFRRAVDALSRFTAEATYSLTQSFRFGRGVARLANELLTHFVGSTKPIIGAGEPQRTRFTVNLESGFAVVARTNAVAFEEAVAHLARHRRYHFVGGPQGYKLEKVLDAYYLSVDERGAMRDPYLRSFSSFGELVSLSEETDDAELRHLVRVVESYGSRIPELVNAISARHTPLAKEQFETFDGIFISTAHKAKGLEWQQVWLPDDFCAFFNTDGTEREEIDPQEINLLYVAITRARAALRVPEQLERWIEARLGVRLDMVAR